MEEKTKVLRLWEPRREPQVAAGILIMQQLLVYAINNIWRLYEEQNGCVVVRS